MIFFFQYINEITTRICIFLCWLTPAILAIHATQEHPDPLNLCNPSHVEFSELPFTISSRYRIGCVIKKKTLRCIRISNLRLCSWNDWDYYNCVDACPLHPDFMQILETKTKKFKRKKKIWGFGNHSQSAIHLWIHME